jgi:hypothetical protein
LPFFLTVWVYVVLGLFLTVLVFTNLPVFALLFTLAMAITSCHMDFARSDPSHCRSRV